MTDLATAIIVAAIGSGGLVGLISLFVPKRRDKLEKHDLLMDNALALAARADEAAKIAMERATAAEKRAQNAENQVYTLKGDLLQMRQINNLLRDDIRRMIRAWHEKLPHEPLPIDANPYID